MEAYIKQIPEQISDSQLQKFFKTTLAKLNISIFLVRKRKKSAILTFRCQEDCSRFLAHHGQIKSNTGRWMNPAGSVNLRLLNGTIYCSSNLGKPDEFILKSLELEYKQQQNKNSAVILVDRTNQVSTTKDDRAFQCLSAACGHWAYEGSDVVFIPQSQWSLPGLARFLPNKLSVELSSGHIIEIFFSSVYSFAVVNEPSPSMTFTLDKPPNFSQKDPLVEMLSLLSIQSNKKTFKAHRLSGMDEAHEKVVGACLVYKFTFSTFNWRHKMSELRKRRDIPTIMYERARNRKPEVAWARQFDDLKDLLSTDGVHTPFPVKFQLQKIAQNGYLLPVHVLDIWNTVQETVATSGTFVTVAALKQFGLWLNYAGPDCEASEWTPEALIKLFRECISKAISEEEWQEQKRASENVAVIHRAVVTPTTIRLSGPEAENKNRVLRKYPEHEDYFLRVEFMDEDRQPVRYHPTISQDNIFYGRFKNVLQNGINIAGRKYDFLGFSHSSLRSQTCWFMAPFLDTTGELLFNTIVIARLGRFGDIRSPAKCAARIGQAFSETANVVPLKNIVVHHRSDIERNGRVFSDGVGTISLSVLDQMWDSLPSRYSLKPTVFQIRYSGAKGMISVDSRLQKHEMWLRPSMTKFPSDPTDIELCGAAYRPLPMYLNRQTIKILEDLGCEGGFFMSLQARAVERLRSSTRDNSTAAKFLRSQNAGDVALIPNLISRLEYLDLKFQADGFLRDIVEMTALIELRALKHKARILVEEGVTLYGIMDETNILKEGEIYCTIDNGRGVQKIITGQNLIITRAPALHPGDVQLVSGVNVPVNHPLKQLSNCIVFSQQGERDLPSMLSGGDLDGDLYNIIWDDRAVIKRTCTPADYPRMPAVDIGRQVVINDMADFFVKFMATDQLGRIAILHQILADQKPLGTFDESCLVLAELHSTAVDFSKTGIAVDLTRLPQHSRVRPDFMAPGPHVKIEKMAIVLEDMAPVNTDDEEFSAIRYYESEKILGKLYRAIDERAIFSSIGSYALNMHSPAREEIIIDAVWSYIKRRCMAIQWEHLKPDAREIRDAYNDCVRNIMTEYGTMTHPLSELEVVVGNIVGKTGAQNKQLREKSTSMKEQYDRDVTFTINSIIKFDKEHSDEALEMSMACVAVAIEGMGIVRGKWGNEEPLRSFLYVATSVCLRELES